MTMRAHTLGLCTFAWLLVAIPMSAGVTQASPVSNPPLTPTCAVSTSITSPRDSLAEDAALRRHHDRVNPALPPEVVARRRAQAFEAQCWAVGAPVVLITSGVLLAERASAAGHPEDAGWGIGLVATGLLVGPSFGWARAGDGGRAVSGALLRTGAVLGGLMLAGAVSDGASGDQGPAALGAGAGLALVLAATVLDVRHLGRHVRAHGFAHDAQFSLLTTHGPGLALTLPLP